MGLTLNDFHGLRAQEERSWDRGVLRKQAGGAFVDTIEQLLPKDRRKWAPDQLVQIERSPWFEDCHQICERYRSATANQRTWLRSRIDRPLAGNLGVFGLKAAVLGAREHSPSLARSALIAFAINDLCQGDIRDVLIGLSLLCHCGTLSGAEMPALFREVAALSGPALSALYTSWAERYPDVQGISAMGWKQIETEEGVGFRHN